MNSCIYEGLLVHRRFAPVHHAFSYRLFMMYLDLDELPRLFDGRWLWSAHRPAPARFRRPDYPGPPDVPLDDSVRDLVRAHTGRRPEGPIRLLTHLRYFGYAMNPVSFFYCFRADGRNVDTVLAHVTNTPWGQTHSYVVTPGRGPTTGDEGGIYAELQKRLHVSPFMSMEPRHVFRFTRPAESLAATIENRIGSQCIFSASLSLRRKEITTASLTWALCRYPAMGLRVAAGIYFQALRLYLKRAPFHPHPRTLPDTEPKAVER